MRFWPSKATIKRTVNPWLAATDELSTEVNQLGDVLAKLQQRTFDRLDWWEARCAGLVREVETERALKEQALARVAVLEQELAEVPRATDGDPPGA